MISAAHCTGIKGRKCLTLFFQRWAFQEGFRLLVLLWNEIELILMVENKVKTTQKNRNWKNLFFENMWEIFAILTKLWNENVYSWLHHKHNQFFIKNIDHLILNWDRNQYFAEFFVWKTSVCYESNRIFFSLSMKRPFWCYSNSISIPIFSIWFLLYTESINTIKF